MNLFYAGFALAFGTAGLSAPTQEYGGTQTSKLVCKDLVLPIKAAANNTALPPYPDSTEPGVLYKYLNFNASQLPPVEVSGTFNISALYCEPFVKVEGREGTIQFLLHGLSATKVIFGVNAAKTSTNINRNIGTLTSPVQSSRVNTRGCITPHRKVTLLLP
jgi:hypothetical protein